MTFIILRWLVDQIYFRYLLVDIKLPNHARSEVLMKEYLDKYENIVSGISVFAGPFATLKLCQSKFCYYNFFNMPMGVKQRAALKQIELMLN